MKSILFFVSCLLIATSASAIPKLNLVPNGTVVAGLSAGAFFTSQYHVAFSSSVVGAGIIAGGPFYCAQNNIDYALTTCTVFPSAINVQTLIGAANYCADTNACDSVKNLANQRVWLFTGSLDTVVYSGVVKDTLTFYQAFTNNSNIGGSIDEIAAEHSWPTNSFGNSCSYFGSPFINNCQYDASFQMLNFILGNVQPGTQASVNNVHTISQGSYTPSNIDPASISMGPNAYVYIPQACANGTQCRVVAAFHGCQQTLADIGTDFVGYTGLNELAESNNFVILYPQVIKSEFPGPLNPEGCFDWWGYTTSNYANKNGPQMITVNNMINSLYH